MTAISELLRDDAGATMVEYAVMLALIAAVCITAVVSLGSKTADEFSGLNTLYNTL